MCTRRPTVGDLNILVKGMTIRLDQLITKYILTRPAHFYPLQVQFKLHRILSHQQPHNQPNPFLPSPQPLPENTRRKAPSLFPSRPQRRLYSPCHRRHSRRHSLPSSLLARRRPRHAPRKAAEIPVLDRARNEQQDVSITDAEREGERRKQRG
jgi:hypothetical protein